MSVSNEDINQLLNFKSDESSIDNPETGRVYSPVGISPTLNTMGGGDREPKIAEGLNTTEGGDAYCVDRCYWKGTSPGDIGSGRRTHVFEPVHTPDFAEKDQNMKSRVGSEDGSMFTVDGTSIHGVLEKDVAIKGDLIEYENPKRQNGIDEEIMFALRNGVTHGVKNNLRIRKLTPRECWRLQGFPDRAFEKAQEVNSDTQLYKQAGNAVTVNVVEAIGREMTELEAFCG